MTIQEVERDERTIAIELAGYRWAYLFMSFGLLVIIVVRGLTRSDRAWDLMALVVLGGAVQVAFRAFHRALHRRWPVEVAITGVAAAIVAALILVVVLVLAPR